MKIAISSLLALSLTLLCSAVYANPDSTNSAEDYQEVTWDDLMPKDWIPTMPEEPAYDEFGSEGDEFGGGFGFANQIQDAPIVDALNNKKIKIPGYVLPTKYSDKGVLEFLLVPYMGACIHVPPPPSNQMVYVTSEEPYDLAELWQPVWISGVMQAKTSMTEYATVGYLIENPLIELYEY